MLQSNSGSCGKPENEAAGPCKNNIPAVFSDPADSKTTEKEGLR